MMDRLGTNRWSTGRFYPYGDEISSTANDREKFATYTRDSYTGFDYADQRYYASTYGRFNTADPYRACERGHGPGDPGSWNRYSYTGGDPVNRLIPAGGISSSPAAVLEMKARAGIVTVSVGVVLAFSTGAVTAAVRTRIR